MSTFNFLFGIFIGVMAAAFSLNMTEDITYLQQVCSKNQGINHVSITVLDYRVTCNDSAYFWKSR